MSVSVWALLGFAVWTLTVLVGTIGAYRIAQVLAGKARPNEFPADRVEGPDFYRRAMRAHANCVENLPVFGAIVFAGVASGSDSGVIDTLAVAVLVARVMHSVVHIGFEQSPRVALVRFGIFAVQVACMLAMAGFIAVSAMNRGAL